MNQQDKRAFAEVVGTLFEVFNQPEPSRRVLTAWWAVLEEYPIEVIQQAANDYLRTGKYPPKPSDIRGSIEGAKRACWPTGDEAWAMVQHADDERETVVWTAESKLAFFQAAAPLLEEGDRVAARRAFLDSYEKHVTAAIEAGCPPKVEISEGHDPAGRRPAIEQAIDRRLLTHEEAAPRLLGCDREVTGDGVALAGLLGYDGPKAESYEPTDYAKRKLAEIKASIEPVRKPTLDERIEEKREEVRVLANSKQSVIEQLREQGAASSDGDEEGER